jgi:hypothetical protein
MIRRKDPLRHLFGPDVLARLAKVRRPQPSPHDHAGIPVRNRHLVIAATGPEPSPSRWAHQQAWVAYLKVADSCGLLNAPDVVSRLTGDDDDGFRSAMAECCAAWYFARKRRARVSPNPASKASKNFDLVVERGVLKLHAEVKAPYVPLVNSSWAGDDASMLRRCVETAGEQFTKGQPNLVVLVPLLRTPVSMHRDQLLKATIGEHALAVPLPPRDGSKRRKPEPIFLQRGKLAKLWPAKGDAAFRTDLTRVSAVMTIEQRRVEETRLVPSVVVIHNPFASHPLPRSFFGRVPQLIVEGGFMRWSDRYNGV